ncbi:MAG: hypothetical protein LKI39_04780 [Bacteroides sp.]|nr:hypothetical protein [Bacteroides sp.]
MKKGWLMKEKAYAVFRDSLRYALAGCFLLFLLSGCIPDDYSGCPSKNEGDVSVTIGVGDSIVDSGQETQMP